MCQVGGGSQVHCSSMNIQPWQNSFSNAVGINRNVPRNDHVKNTQSQSGKFYMTYIGSFQVIGEDQAKRTEYCKEKLAQFKDANKSKPVLLVISLSGIKVCSHTGESVYMAHALKRISYATCDPDSRQFSFLAREPKGQSTLQYCHAFMTQSEQEAEELNTIVGNAFKMAYALQKGDLQPDQEALAQAEGEEGLPQGHASPAQPTFQELIEQQLEEKKQKQEEYNQQQQAILRQRLHRISTPNIEEQLRERRGRRQSSREGDDSSVEDMPLPRAEESGGQSDMLTQKLQRISTPNIEEHLKERRERRQKEQEEMEQQRLQGKKGTWAKQHAHKARHKDPFMDDGGGYGMNGSRPHSMDPTDSGSRPLSTNSADSAGSGTVVGAGARFHTITELRDAMDAGSLRAYGSPVMTLKDTIDNHFTGYGAAMMTSPAGGAPALRGIAEEERRRQSSPHPSPITSPTSVGDRASCHVIGAYTRQNSSPALMDRPLPDTPDTNGSNKQAYPRHKSPRRASPAGQHRPKLSRDHLRHSASRSRSGSRTRDEPSTCKHSSVRYQNASPVPTRAGGGGDPALGAADVAGAGSADGTANAADENSHVYQGPPTPIRYDSLRRLDPRDLPVDEELQAASWYQPGIPREIALEILNQQEIGSFIVRDSTTHPHCYALSVKVPKFDNPSGISHYLILRSNRGVKLKGLDKEWSSLTQLVTHHTVMSEMLPCTLRLPRTASNPLYRDRDDDRDENYQRISDFSGMLQEMKI